MRSYPEIKFILTNMDARKKLRQLLAWLLAEESKLRLAFEKVPEDKSKTDALGRQIMTENARRRDAIAIQIARVADDIETARVWLIECDTEQSWQIGLELAHWLNRPALAESNNG